MYQILYKTGESRNSAVIGPVGFPSAEERDKFARSAVVYWYHYSEWDDWHQWRRGGGWEATWQPGPADIVPEPPEIKEEDRWL